MHADPKRPSRGYGVLKTMTARDKPFSEVCNIPSNGILLLALLQSC
jgi:hypothetical protein